jgi:golgi phosphoprotein 3
MLTFGEELVLLALNDEKGDFGFNLSRMKFENALAGTVLMDLAFLNRIDTDLEHLILVDKTPTQDALFDAVIALIAAEAGPRSAGDWIREVRYRHPNLRGAFLQKLLDRGILKQAEQKILWVFKQRRYPVIDNREEKEVKARIRETVLEQGIPDPRDVVLISLMTACDLIDEVFSKEERKKALDRIEQLSRMDLIGQAIFETILKDIIIPISY